MKRLQRETTDWHVTVRGARRLLLFRDEEDYQVFYGTLADALKRTGATLHAQCLLSNHAHLSPRASSAQLSELMFRTEQPYSVYHNRKYRLSGHAYDGPYFNKEAPSPRVLAFVTRYIHLNPVRAGIATRPEHYRWSSAAQYLGDGEGPIRVDPMPTLRGYSPRLDAARALYGEFVLRGLRRPSPLPASGWSALDLWQEEFRWILEDARAPVDRSDALTREDVAILIGVQAGIPPRAIGKVLGTDGPVISRRIYALKRLLESDPPLRALISGHDVS